MRSKGGSGGGKKPTFSQTQPQSKAPTVSNKTSVPRNEIDVKRTGHIFRKKTGHLEDIPANRQKLEDVANKPEARLGSDKHGNEWYAETQSDGSQVWVSVRDGKITNGGVNNPPKPYNSDTGLSAPHAPGYPK